VAKAIAPSAAVTAARARRSAKVDTKLQWFADQVANVVELSMRQRVRLAAAYLKTKVVKNISVPVVKGVSKSGRRVVMERSVPGEFPRADTTNLMKGIFDEVREVGGGWEGYVGTPTAYGLMLELRMDRSFLVRTFYEERPMITKIMGGPLTYQEQRAD
jgi:hypothetical protein